jgi:nitrile hydratase
MTEHDSDKLRHIHDHLHSDLPSDPALRVRALESLLVEKGMVDPRTVEAWIQAYAEDVGPKRGAEIIARAWTDPSFRERLLASAGEAIGDLGMAYGHLKIVENTAEVHNLIVCTLCSCYPISILGIPPAWYKAAAYRSRAVRDPRGVLAEFGVDLAESIEICVHDTTAELRYLVLPQRPAGTEGWTEEQLARLITRNAMIGTERDLSVRVAAAR